MKYEVRFKPRSIKDLRKIHPAEQSRILQKIEQMVDRLTGDVKQLTNFTPEYRLRVGDYRVLFEIEGETIVVYRIRHRREVYR
jgi:mRNA interferase RelE/StbE